MKQVDYIVNNGWTPCLEFADPEHAYVSNENCIRFGAVSSGYQDNRVSGAALLCGWRRCHGGARAFAVPGQVLLARRARAARAALLADSLLLPARPPAVLDHVEAAHVRLQRRHPGAEGDCEL